MRRDCGRRYRAAQEVEAQLEPGWGGPVLRNLAGIRTKTEMDRAEFEALVRVEEDCLHRLTAETRFTANLICEMHRDWLGGLYAWAGRYRTVEMSKGGFTWPPAYLIPDHMANL